MATWEEKWAKDQEKKAKRQATAALFDAVRGGWMGEREAEAARKIQEALAAGANVNAKTPRAGDNKGSRALHLASRWASGPVLDALIEAGADPNAAREDGKTPMHLAAGRSKGAAEAIDRLVRAGGLVGALDAQGQPPLAEALGAGRVEIEAARALLAAGADWPVGDMAEHDFRWTAALSRNWRALEFMAAEGADLSARRHGQSLWQALAQGQGRCWGTFDEEGFARCCDVLESSGASASAENSSIFCPAHRDPLCAAIWAELPLASLKRLARAVGDFSTMEPVEPARVSALRSVLAEGAKKQVQAAFDLGLSPSWRDADGAGVLETICKGAANSRYANSRGAIEAAAQAGVDLNAPGARGARPLAWALACDPYDGSLVKEMLDAGADPTLLAWREGPNFLSFSQNPQLPTPVGHDNTSNFFMRQTRRASWGVVERMIELGADLNDQRGAPPPLYLALRGKSACSAQALLGRGALWEPAFECLERETDADGLKAMAFSAQAPSSPQELPWELRQWLDAGASPSRLFAALGKASEKFKESFLSKHSPTMAMLEALSLREQTQAPGISRSHLPRL